MENEHHDPYKSGPLSGIENNEKLETSSMQIEF